LSTPDPSVVLGKVTRRIIPFLFILYVGAFLDRVNVSVAKLTMMKDLGYTETIYGTGAGIFFIGYFLFEVPSNLILAKTGARVWIARIMITWGIISSLMMFAKTPAMFNTLRFLLGVAEAGFFPGMIYYLTNWYPAVERARAISRFMMAIPIAYMIGNPIGGALLGLDGVANLRGWQWLFLLEGIPSIILGIITIFYLTDSPAKANWLSADEKASLITRLEAENRRKEERHSMTLLQAFSNPRVLMLNAIYFCIVVGGYGLALNLPSIVKTLAGQSNFISSLISAIPYTCAAVGMILVGKSSDRTKERRWHVAIPCFVGAIGMAMAALLHDPIPGLIGLCLAAFGQSSTLAPFWAMTTSFLSGTAAAGSIALINSVGNLGGYFGPQVMGRIKDETKSFTAALLLLGGILALAGILSICAHHDPSLEAEPDEHIPDSPEEVVLEAMIQ
jgi:ACS family tartrate transporter-like MFS transporter